jgi:hypothetical protein
MRNALRLAIIVLGLVATLASVAAPSLLADGNPIPSCKPGGAQCR